MRAAAPAAGRDAIKRVVDIVLALLGLLLLSPVLVAAALAIWIEDRHAPFYVGKRCARQGAAHGGRDGLACFRMVKFRSMVPHAWKTGVSSTASSDRRITRVGAVLRRAKLDELPQLWNVLLGDMSLVGPRPQVETDARLYTREERRLLSVRPGMTDLASLVFADEGAILADAPDPDLRYNQVIRPWKSRLGLLYIEHRGMAADAGLILLTLLSGISRRAALRGACWLAARWHADPLLLRMTARQEPLLAWPPPGAAEIVATYPRTAHA